MRVRDAVLLGAVQGLTEFMPVSSSAHLALLRRFGGPAKDARAFEVALHLATAASLVAAMRGDALAPARALFIDLQRHGPDLRRYSSGGRVALRLALATLPAVATGTLARRQLDRWAECPSWIAGALLGGSLAMALAQAWGRDRRSSGAADVGAVDTLLVGVAQAAALAPGVSRSGATIAAGMLRGLDRERASRLSFQLALPVTLAAAAATSPATFRLVREVRPTPVAAGMAAATATGLLSIAALRRLLAAGGLIPFIWYRCLLAALVWATRRRGRAAVSHLLAG